jgi:hypothetical protein
MKKAIMPLTSISALLFSAVAGAQFVTLTKANPFQPIWICEGDVSSDRSAEPPTFLVLASENYTLFAADTISLSLSKSFPTAVAVASVTAAAVIGAGLLVYFKKCKR